MNKALKSYNELSADHPDVQAQHVEGVAELGNVQIHNNVIATIARLATLTVPGVVEMSGGMVDSLAGIIGKRGSDRGIRVEVDDQGVALHLHVLMEYGVRIPVVSGQIQDEVRKAVEHMTGKAVRAVEVIVEGVRVMNDKRAATEGNSA